MQRLTMDKATQYSQKSLEKLRKAVQELVSFNEAFYLFDDNMWLCAC